MSVSHLTDDLVLLSSPPQHQLQSPTLQSNAAPTEAEESLRSLLLYLKPPLSHSQIINSIRSLEEYDSYVSAVRSGELRTAEGEEGLRTAIMGKLIVGLYAETMDIFLKEATETENEAEWWGEVERSTFNVWHYFVQTLPSRLFSLLHRAASILHAQGRSLRASDLSISSMRHILSEKDASRPNTLVSALFPHLNTHPHLMPLSLAPFKFRLFSLQPPSIPTAAGVQSTFQAIRYCISEFIQSCYTFVSLPFELTRQECHLRREKLERVRNERAEVLGELVGSRDQLAQAIRTRSDTTDAYIIFLRHLNEIISEQNMDEMTLGPTPSLLKFISMTASESLPRHSSLHHGCLRNQCLLRPSRLTLIWPRLLIIPPLTLLAAREFYASRDSLTNMAVDAWETIKGFWRGWLVEPVKGILKTVRTGGDGGVIVQKDSIEADMQSLERMALSLAKEKLNYSQEQLDIFSKKIRSGDLTPILEIYEEDIKRPVKSAIVGTLLRSVFVQVQKAKVDIDQALAGIDKLLKSQELTFAFVGVAPALAILYVAGGSLGTFFGSSISRRKGRFGGKHKRTAAWLAIRRIERLLISQPRYSAPQKPHNRSRSDEKRPQISPLTSGLLLLNLSSLRNYAETYLPLHSRLREGFLEDIGDLEDPSLDRDEKVKVVERMWRSWGPVLDWNNGAGAIGRT